MGYNRLLKKPSIKLAIFDLSNVCFSSEEPPFIHDFCLRNALNEEVFDAEYQELLQRSEVDEISGIEVWRGMLAKYSLKDDPKKLIRDMMDKKEAYYDTLNIAKRLKKEGYKTAYLTNYNRDYWMPIKRKWDMSEYFSDGVVSYQIKERKPAAKGFKTLMEKFGALPEETIFIDDSVKNLEAAKALGLKTHQFISAKGLGNFLSKEGLLKTAHKKNHIDVVREYASGEVYTQSTMMTPISIMGAARSMINLKRLTNLSYKGFLFEFKEDYGSIFYQVSDLTKLGKEIWKRLKKDKKYFEKIRKIHAKEQIVSRKFYKEIQKKDLSKATDTELQTYLNRAIQAIQDAVGVGHIIEGFALTSDEKLKAELLKYTKDIKLNNSVYSELTTPEEKSFLRQADEDLEKIAKFPKNTSLIQLFKRDFYWIRSSYASKGEVDDGYVKTESKIKKHLPKWSSTEIKNRKKDLVKKFKIPKDLVWKINLLSFVGAWQDERKKYIMTGAHNLFWILDELASRTGIELKYLKYLTPLEFGNAKDILSDLTKRYKHSLYVADHKTYYVISGHEAKHVKSLMKKDHKDHGTTLNGTVASSGKVIGLAKICTDFKSLSKVNEGDILVASMTRPEYISVMKKASAFVTDEGGITSHAAIVAREMKKPCVIGTKVATKVLNDGDLVEVDANHGTVKIIKN